MDSALNVPQLLRQYGLTPDKRLGQHFLVDPVALGRIVEAADLSPRAQVLEVGPGVGSLTVALAPHCRRLVAVEVDPRFRLVLERVLHPYPHVEVIFGDILAQDPAVLMGDEPYLVVANLPYYITGAVVRHLLTARRRPRRMVLTVQREVAARITATPGQMSLLSVSVQVFGEPRVVARVPRGAFYPLPEVESAVVRVEMYPEPRVPEAQLPVFFRVARAGFAQRRKNLRNALSAGLGLTKQEVEAVLRQAAIEPTRRAESLNMEEWQRLTALFVQRLVGEGKAKG